MSKITVYTLVEQHPNWVRIGTFSTKKKAEDIMMKYTMKTGRTFQVVEGLAEEIKPGVIRHQGYALILDVYLDLI